MIINEELASNKNESYDDIKIGIISALPEESAAIKSLLTKVEPVNLT